MSKPGNLKRKSFFVDEKILKRAKHLLRVSTDAEAIRLSLERVTEMERFQGWLEETGGTLEPGSFEQP